MLVPLDPWRDHKLSVAYTRLDKSHEHMNSTVTSSELFAPLSAPIQLINRTHRNRKWGTEYKKLRHNGCIINIKNLRMTLPKGGGAPVAPVPKFATVRCMRSGCKHTGGRWQTETSQLISQERIGVGSSNLVDELITWRATYGHCSRSIGQSYTKY